MNFSQVTGFSVVPSLLIPRTIIVFYCRLLKPSTSSSPWMTKFMKETLRFHFGTQIKPEKHAKDDTGHMVFKNDSSRIQSKHAHWFHICSDAADMPSAPGNHLLYMVGSQSRCSSSRVRVLWRWSIPSSSQGNSYQYHPHSNSNSQHSGKGCHSRSMPSNRTLCSDELSAFSVW